MKTVIKTLLLPISLWAACTGNKTKDFIPGTYVNHAQSEYSVANDTLIITKDQHSPISYHISRRTGYQRVKDSKLQPEQHQVKSFTGLWDTEKQTLQLIPNGIILLFQPDQNKLMIENSAYTKI